MKDIALIALSLHSTRPCGSTNHLNSALIAATGKAFTMVLAGLAFTLISWPKAILLPALVAGFLRVLILQRLGIVKILVFFTSVVARVAKLSRSPEHTFVLSSCCSASVLII